MTSGVMKLLEDEMFKTKGAVPRYVFQPGAILREPGWNFDLLKRLCDRNFVMEMITRTLTQEIARPGLEVKPRFVKKCTKCKAEYQSEIEECETTDCKSTEFRGPDPTEKAILDAILQRPNSEYDWDKILRSMVEHDLKEGNWWLSVTFQKYMDAETHKIEKKVLDIFIEDPCTIRIMADEKARIRSTEYFCPTCYKAPDQALKLQPEEIASGNIPTCPICHLPLEMTAYLQVIQGNIAARWGTDEIVHGSSTQSLPELYGRPRALTVWKWIIVLNAMLNYLAEIYSTGYVGGFLTFKGLNQSVVNSIKAQIEKELETKQALDPVTGEPELSLRIRTAWIGTGEINNKPLEVEFIPAMPEPKQMQSLETFKFAIEKVCSVYGVTPVFVSIIESGKSGNNPRMQIDVQNRTIQEGQQSIVSTLNHKLIPLLKIHDWELGFKEVELRDELRTMQVHEVRARAAAQYLAAGYTVQIDPNTGDMKVSGEGRPPAQLPGATVGPSGPEISEESGAILDKRRISLPDTAMYLVEPHGFLVWSGGKSVIVKKQRYPQMENRPLLLVGPQSAYAVIRLLEPKEINQKQFKRLYPQHRVTDTEAKQWGWSEEESLWTYKVEVLARFSPLIPIAVPSGTQSFVKTENIEFGHSLRKILFYTDEGGGIRMGILEDDLQRADVAPAGPEHHDPPIPRKARTAENNLAKRLQGLAIRYHGRQITKKEALESGQDAIEKHYRIVRAIALNKFRSSTKAKIETLPPEVEERLHRSVPERMEEFRKQIDDVQEARRKR